MTDGASIAQEVVQPDEEQVTTEFIAFLEAASLRRAAGGRVRRFNQGRPAGCVQAEFIVPDGLAEHLRVGLFASAGTYRAFIRFANAASATDRESDVRGMSVRLFDVPGANLTEGATVQDFVLNSHPVMVAPDTKAFMALLRALDAGRFRAALHLATRPRQLRIAAAARDRPSCHLDITYWSTTPYLFGPGRAVKYIARPASGRASTKPKSLTDTYLSDALKTRLAEGDACFDFLVQFQTDPVRMPVEDASVEWEEGASPYVPVARIRIPAQRFDAPDQLEACERTAFNPWNALREHRPLGNMNRARRRIYPALAGLRGASLR
jgi:hypothetical protein